MQAEIRADGLHIFGYVNVPGRESRPVITPHGKVIEIIEQRAFQKALEKVDNIDLKLDHKKTIASTKEGTLTLYEDEVGLRAEATISDEETVKGAKDGKLKGWSFNMARVIDSIEERAGKLPIRRVKDFLMTEVTLSLNSIPYYSSTSIELRAEDGEEIEVRASETEITVSDKTVETPPKEEKKQFDNSNFKSRINALKK